jgi:Xaa-Pro aminopeptidase
VGDAGQREAVRAAEAGRTELEVFADVRRAMEVSAGGRVCLAGELSAGHERTVAVFDWPRNRVLEQGDPVVVDLAPRVGGYWADGCNTLVVGGSPSPELARLLDGARRGLERAQETMRPGITAAELDAEVKRAVVDGGGGLDFAHHSGHGIGVAVHEAPRLVPGDDTVLQPGMVLMVEPASYRAGTGGARLEWMFLVTEDGNEVVSTFEHRVA